MDSGREALLLQPSDSDIQIAYHGSLIGLSTKVQPASWSVFKRQPAQRLPPNIINQPYGTGPNQLEKAYAISFFNNSSNAFAGPAGPAAPAISPVQPRQAEHPDAYSRSETGAYTPTAKKTPTQTSQTLKRFSLLKDVSFGTFIDIVGQVVKTFPEGDRFTLYVTDYTRNVNLYNYPLTDESTGRDGDEFDYISSRPRKRWPGPFGQMTLQITLWEPHSWFARQNVKENDFVHLQNIRVKPSKYSGSMEGAIHTDRLYPDKIQVRVIDSNEPDELVKDVVRRKREYWKKINAKRQLPDSETPTRKKANTNTNTNTNKQVQEKQKNKDPNQQRMAPSVPIKRDELNTHSKDRTPIDIKPPSLTISHSSRPKPRRSMYIDQRHTAQRHPYRDLPRKRTVSTPLPECAIQVLRASSRFLPTKPGRFRSTIQPRTSNGD